ncbi:MAG: restriction endonuclease subunit S [Pseudolabrys sp.]|nr:restriction endonuclease subunit S [Pseudolabrys sp.]
MSKHLPVGWSIKMLGDLAQVVSGGTPSRNVHYFWDGGTIPWITPTDITGTPGKYISEPKDRITKLGLMSCSTSLLPPGSILMTSRATLGEAKISTVSACTNQGFKSLVAKKGVSNEFLYYQIQRTKQEYARYGSGSTFLEVSRKDTVGFPVLIPDEASQTKIAGVLSLIDTQIEATEALIAKQEQVRAGLMQDLFTRGVDEHGQLRPPREDAPHLYYQTELGWLPKEWEAPLLDSVANRVSGHTPNRLKPEYWNGAIKWVSLADSSSLDRPFISETTHEISALGIQNSSARLLPAGTVFVSRDAGVGKSAIMAVPMAVSQHFIGWICGGKLNHLFLYYFLQINKSMFENIATGSTIVTIGLGFFRRMRVVRPSDVDEQVKIARVLKAVDDRLDEEKNTLCKLRLQKSGLMQDLLTGKVPIAPLLEGVTA